MPHSREPVRFETGPAASEPAGNDTSDACRMTQDIEHVAMELAEHARVLVDGTAALFCRRTSGGLSLDGYSASDAELTEALRQRKLEQICGIAPELPLRVMELGQPLVVPAAEIQADLASSGQVLLVPLQAGSCSSVLLVYRGPEPAYHDKEIGLVCSAVRLAATAMVNGELPSIRPLETCELRRLQAICFELRRFTEFSALLEQLVLKAVAFLEFKSGFIGLVEGSACRALCIAEEGAVRQVDELLYNGACCRTLARCEPCWGDDSTELLGIERLLRAESSVRQYLTVPLKDDRGHVLGVLGLLNSSNGCPVSAEDLRRATLIASEFGLVLGAAQELRLARQQRRNAEELVSMALYLNSARQLSDWVHRFAERTSELVSARAAALALARGALLETVVLHEPGARPHDPEMLRQLDTALTLAIAGSPCTNEGAAESLLGSRVAAAFGWTSVMLLRLDAADGTLLGMLCLADYGELHSAERNLLQALTAQASVALENARLFTRMEQANRDWMEIFDSMTDSVVVHDEDENVVHVNRSLADFIGVRTGQLIGVNMRALVSLLPETDPLHGCPFCEQTANANGDYLYRVLDRTYLVSTSRVRAGFSDNAQTIHVLKDITDRCEAERRYRELFDSLQEGLYFASPDGRFVEVNDALVRMLGYESREELLQLDIASELYITPKRWERFKEAVERSGSGLRNFEERLRRKDGSAVHMLQNAFAIRDAQGGVLQYRGLMLDITDLKNYQAELQRERDFSSKILNNTQSMILVVDTAGLVSYVNRRCCEAGHYEESGLLGRRVVELVLGQRRHQMAHAVEMCLLGQQVDNLELPIVLGDGHTGQFSINLSPMRDEQGSVNSIVVVMTDITDASMLKAKLIHTEKMAAVGQLVSGVAHEVNNPLTAVLGFADLLLENQDVPEEAKKEVAVILQEAQRTKQIVQNLLSFARQMPPQRRSIDVNDVLRRTLALRAYDFANHDIEVAEQLDPNLANVVGDAHQLQQVFLNIINNAYDALHETGSKGRIEIETSMSGKFVEVRFRDNGPGVLYPDRIFDPFFTTKEVGKGTGLGLSICYGIVHEHGGDISCQNNSGFSGAIFTVRLPAGGRAAAAKGAL